MCVCVCVCVCVGVCACVSKMSIYTMHQFNAKKAPPMRCVQ